MQLIEIFEPFLRSDAVESLRPDGTPVSLDSPGVVEAQRLFQSDPTKHAVQIVALMKPLCRPFPIDQIVRRIQNSAVDDTLRDLA